MVVSIGFCMLIPVNYSYGLKLSYRGAGELVIAIGAAGTVLIPFALVMHGVSPALGVEAVLVGLWHAQVVVFSNTHDAAGDRATGRMTIAARTSEAGNRTYIAAVFGLSFAIGTAAVATRIVPFAYLLVLGPLWAMQGHQLWVGVGQRRWLDARRMGFLIIRIGIVGLVLANLLLRN
jgi:1,4-dihydroxy-2-naphthoate octaprenyltransferase